MGIRFTIDHYIPRSRAPELEHTYNNLMYCCDRCNILKGSIFPNEALQATGHHFYRADKELFFDVFEVYYLEPYGYQLKGRNRAGEYTIDVLELNRQQLTRIRKIRQEWLEAEKFIAHGAAQLKGFPIDRLPKHIRGKAWMAVKRCLVAMDETQNALDRIVEEYARSPLLDDDESAAQRRKTRLMALRAMKSKK